MNDSLEMLTGVSITLVTPALVEVAKQLGMPVRFAGLAAMAIAFALLVLGGVAAHELVNATQFAKWALSGIVYGLAAAGLYSQVKPPKLMG